MSSFVKRKKTEQYIGNNDSPIHIALLGTAWKYKYFNYSTVKVLNLAGVFKFA
jgi:hypothetical protein